MKRLGVCVEDLKGEIKKVVNSEVSKSEKMRRLFDLGLEVKEIANIMGVKYNFVYNVISNYVNIEDIEVIKENKGGKKERIIELFLEGKSNKEISKILRTNYNYVYKVIKEYGELQVESK